MMQSLHWRRLDQRRMYNRLSLMYEITHNLIAISISDFLIPLIRPSQHYHLLSTLDQFNQAVCKIDHFSPEKITILLLLNLTCFLTYFIFGRCILITSPASLFLFLALLIFLQRDAHMSRSPSEV